MLILGIGRCWLSSVAHSKAWGHAFQCKVVCTLVLWNQVRRVNETQSNGNCMKLYRSTKEHVGENKTNLDGLYGIYVFICWRTRERESLFCMNSLLFKILKKTTIQKWALIKMIQNPQKKCVRSELQIALLNLSAFF